MGISLYVIIPVKHIIICVMWYKKLTLNGPKYKMTMYKTFYLMLRYIFKNKYVEIYKYIILIRGHNINLAITFDMLHILS